MEGSHHERWIVVDPHDAVHARIVAAGNSRAAAERIARTVLPELAESVRVPRWHEATDRQRQRAKTAYTVTPAIAARLEAAPAPVERRAAGGGQ